MTQKRERVLLTGARGFFGRRIQRSLLDHGYEVVSPGRPDFDLLDSQSVRRTLTDVCPDIVVHSAAYYGGLGLIASEPVRVFHENALMALNILDASAAVRVRRFVSIGSACAYAGQVDGDMQERDYWSGPLHPSVEAYGFIKKMHQVGVHAYAKQYGLAGQFPIITNLYGEHDVFGEYRSHVAAALIKKFADAKQRGDKQVVCWGTGSPVREFIYVGDAAEAVVRLMGTSEQEPVNIGTGIGTSIRQLAELIAQIMRFDGEIIWDTSRPDGVMRKVLDVSKMKRILHWAPPHSLSEGLAKTIHWYLANKEAADSRQ